MSFLALTITIGLVSFGLLERWLVTGEETLAYLAAVWGTDVLIAFLVMPLCAARLRDIGWPAPLSLLILVFPLLSTRLMVLIAAQHGGLFEAPHWIDDLMSIATVLLLAGLSVLFFKRGRNDVRQEL